MSPIQGYGNINLYESAATANYNALQVQVQRRAAKGLFLGVSYTWSKAMATALSGGTNDNSFVRPDQYNRLANYSPASFDRQPGIGGQLCVHGFQAARFGNAWTKLITDGWQISGVTMAQTGAPFTPGVSVQNSSNQIVTGSYTEGWRPAIVAGCNPYTGSGNWTNYLNPACFVPAQVGSKGLESGINYLRAPGGLNFDMALRKGICGHQRRKGPLPVPCRRIQRLQPHHLHGCEQHVGLHGISRQQQRRYHRPTGGIHLNCAGRQ